MSDHSQLRWAARTDGTVWRSVGDEVVIMDLDPGVYFALRGIGGEIWRMLAERPRTVGELVSLLGPLYDVPLATLEADIGRYLEELQAKRLATPATT